jgi:hypothetical protein
MEVDKMMQQEEKPRVQGRSARKHLVKQIVERFADGRWHKRIVIEAALPQHDAVEIEEVLNDMCEGRYGVRAEMKETFWATYRIYNHKQQYKTLSVHRLREELGPLIKQIFEASQGLGKMMGNLHPQAQRYAVIIDRAIQRLKQRLEG